MAMAMAGGAKTNSIRGGKTSDKAAGGPEGAVGVGERAASVRDGGGQLGKAGK